MDIRGIVDCEVLSEPNHPWFEWEGGRGTSPTDWNTHPDLLEGGRIRFAVGAFLLRGGPLGERTVLVDAGNGPVGDGFLPDGRLPRALASHGVGFDDVTDVVLTHLHYDHTGWLAIDGKPAFPNARIHVAAADIAWFTDPRMPGMSAEVTPGRLAAVADRLHVFDGACTPVPGLNAVPAPGHTPGSTVFVASDGPQRVVFLGDVVHCPVQLVDSEWAVLGDVDPLLAARTRENLERELDGAEIAGAHFPGLALGRVIRANGTRRWTV